MLTGIQLSSNNKKLNSRIYRYSLSMEDRSDPEMIAFIPHLLPQLFWIIFSLYLF